MASIREYETMASERQISQVVPAAELWQPQLRAELNAFHTHGGQGQVQTRIAIPPTEKALKHPDGVDIADLRWEYQWHATYADAVTHAVTRWQTLHGKIDPNTHQVIPRDARPETPLALTYSYDRRDPAQVARYQRWATAVYPALQQRLPHSVIVQQGLMHDINGPETVPPIRVAVDPRRPISPAWVTSQRAAQAPVGTAPEPDRGGWDINDGIDDGPDDQPGTPRIIPNEKPRSPHSGPPRTERPTEYAGNMDPETGKPLAPYQVQGYTWQAMRARVHPSHPMTLWFLGKGRGTTLQIIVDKKTQRPRTAATFQGIVETAHQAGASVDVMMPTAETIRGFQSAMQPFLDNDTIHLTDTTSRAPWVVVPVGTRSAVLAQYHATTGHLTPVIRATNEQAVPWILPKASVMSRVPIHGQTFFDGFCAQVGAHPDQVQNYVALDPPPELVQAVQHLVHDPEWPKDPEAQFPRTWDALASPPPMTQPWWILPTADAQWFAIQPLETNAKTPRWAQWRNPHDGQLLYGNAETLQQAITQATPEIPACRVTAESLTPDWRHALQPLLSYQADAFGLDDPADARWRFIRPTRAEKWIAVHPGPMRRDGSIPLTALKAPNTPTPQIFTATDIAPALQTPDYHPTVIREPESIPARWKTSVGRMLQPLPAFQPGVYRWVPIDHQATTWVAATPSLRDTGNPLAQDRLTVLRNDDALRTPRLFTTAETQMRAIQQRLPHTVWHPQPVTDLQAPQLQPWKPSLVHVRREVAMTARTPDWRWIRVHDAPRHHGVPDAHAARPTLTAAVHHRRILKTPHRPVHVPPTEWISVRPAADGNRLEFQRADAQSPTVPAQYVDNGPPVRIVTSKYLPGPATLRFTVGQAPATWQPILHQAQRTLAWTDPADPRWRLVPSAEGHIAIRPNRQGQLQVLVDAQTQHVVRWDPQAVTPSALEAFAAQNHMTWHPSVNAHESPPLMPQAWGQSLAQQVPAIASPAKSPGLALR